MRRVFWIIQSNHKGPLRETRNTEESRETAHVRKTQPASAGFERKGGQEPRTCGQPREAGKDKKTNLPTTSMKECKPANIQ